MASVTEAFVHATVDMAGLTITPDGEVLSGTTVICRVGPAVDGQIPDTAFFDLIECVRDRLGDQASYVFAYAARIRPDDLGVLGLAIKTAPTLRHSIRRVERYFRLLTDTAEYRLEESGDEASVIFEPQTAPHPALDVRNECALAGFARTMQGLVGPDLRLRSVSFRHAHRSDPQLYADHFGCPVQFGAERDAISMDRTLLDLPTRLGDKGVSDFLTAHLDREIEKVRDARSLKMKILRRISNTLSGGVPPAPEIARAFGMSERTFYRRLSDEGLTYRDVLRHAQAALAQELLSKSTYSIAEIAFLTGFSEQSTFSRAFKRWIGQAPAQYRKQAENA